MLKKEEVQMILRSNRLALRDQLMVRHVIPSLMDDGVLSKECAENLLNDSKCSDEEKVDRLLELLLETNDISTTYRRFVEALEHNYDWLAQQLRDTAVNNNNNQRENDDPVSPGIKRRKTEVTSEMVKMMRQSPRLIRNWQTLAHRMKMTSEAINIQTRINKECMDQDQCISFLVQSWESLRPGEAYLENLVEHLRAEDFNDIAEKLADKFLRN